MVTLQICSMTHRNEENLEPTLYIYDLYTPEIKEC